MSRHITLLKTGLATSIQDQGRQGYYHLGIPPSGAMDQLAFQSANLLVGNPAQAAVLECTLMGPVLRFDCDAHMAVTGASMQPIIDGVAHPTHTNLAIKAGTVVRFDVMRSGARAYIAFSGGIDVPEVLGSRSFYSLGAIGGLNGQKLADNDSLPLGEANPSHAHAITLPENLRSRIAKHTEIRVMPGLYDHRLSEEAKQTFYADCWQVASEADRIGYRFKGGRPLQFKPRQPPFGAGSDPSNIVDAPYPIGSIQVPGGLEPIILHRDAVSGGGYAMIATVISADMDIIGQMQPNYSARFVAVSMEEALAARSTYQQQFAALHTFFSP